MAADLLNHPARAAAQDEIHARPAVPISAPARVRRVVFVFDVEPEAGVKAVERFARWYRGRFGTDVRLQTRQIHYTVGDRRVVWELHNEFVTFTWLAPADDSAAFPQDIGLDVESEAGSRVALAVRVDVIGEAVIPPAALVGFDQVSLCHSTIEDGRAEIATDFVEHSDGFTRYELAAGQLGRNLTGIIIRRILEIETYRVLALLGLPLSRSILPALGELESRLAHSLGSLGEGSNSSQNHAALERLHALQIDVAHLSEQIRYRFAASRAYGRVLFRRLESLGEAPVGELRSLRRYLQHRIEPALWTLEAIERRQNELLEQMGRVTAMLNTRIGLDIQVQNQSILKTISDTSQSQLRLQTTVEGLSTIAIAYYLLSLVSYVLQGVETHAHFNKPLVVALLAPLALAGAWIGIRRIRHRP